MNRPPLAWWSGPAAVAETADMPTPSRFDQTPLPTGRGRACRAAVVLIAVAIQMAAGIPSTGAGDAAPTQAERMAALGLLRYRGD